jgi:choloylglycine hydrolase
MRAVSVPLGITTPGQPNIASTIWRTAADQKNKVFFFDSATRPNAFRVSMAKLDFKPGAPVRKLTVMNGEVYSGETAELFKTSEPFKFLPATAN